MANTAKNNNSKVWAEKMSKEWSAFIPPERPSFEEMAIYEDYLKKVIEKRGKNIKALILGATPELRDLLAKYKIKTICADINPDMVEAMNRLLEVSDGKEKIVITNWEKITLKDKQFDIILGDHFIHWIPFKNWDDFFRDKKRLLKDGGYIIANVVTVEKNEAITIEKMIEIFKAKKFFSREEKFYYVYLALFGLVNKSKGYVELLDNFNKKIGQFRKKGKITSKEQDILSCPWVGGLSPVMAPKEEVDAVFNKHFILKSIRYSPLNPSVSCHKIYFMQKNG